MKRYTVEYWQEVQNLEHYFVVHFLHLSGPADRVEYWGQVLALPAINEVEIVKVLRDGQEWEDYSDDIENIIWGLDWVPAY